MNQVTAGLWLIGRLLYRALMLWLWLLLLFYLGFKLAERGQAIDALPAQLEVEGVVLIGGESGIREGCGVAVLRLSSAMRVRLQREGLAALQEARQARGYPERDYYHYQAWQTTPAKGAAEGLSPIMLGLQCADADDELTARISRASQEAGGYYSQKDEGALLLLPREGLVVFGYFG
ncbi:hypothetical protein SBP02_18775 [Pseudomonas benzenivorans]|uniref:Uncharacterized protein n=1 Tax=Pseudomonas benzenivorans TaxID=556533 RepID=A0ABZ0PV48_9PSED|nr:hypothetical protein [Pseudomonas benzenivorans]WPC04776.1 hypothetical protein SBP02_18775 [Pseudomonas benzenivorans]